MKTATHTTENSAPDAGAGHVSEGGIVPEPCLLCTKVSKSGYRSDQKSLYQQLLTGLYDAVLITDPNGYVIDTNPRVEEFFQYTNDETWDIMVGELVAGVDAALLDRVRKGLDKGRFILLDAKCVRKDGSTFAGEVSISTIKLVNGGDLVFTVRNVDRRKNAWQKLKSGHNAWLRAPAPGIISEIDGTIRSANFAALKLWGHAAEETLVGKSITTLWDDDRLLDDALKKVRSGGKWRGELTALTNGGTGVPTTVTLENEVQERGEVTGLLCSIVPAKAE